MSTINFDTRGAWNAQEVLGPAVHAPPAIRDIHVTTLRIEWLDVSEPEKDFYAKNHMVTTLIFREPVSIDGTEDMSSARLSMELDETVTSEDKVASVEVRSAFIVFTHLDSTCASVPDLEVLRRL